MSDKQTHFGYQQVNKEDKASLVGEVFHSVASKYDLMNDLMSGGVHRLWKEYTIQKSGARRGHRVLDLAGGTGDLARRFAGIVGDEGSVHVADINNSMLSMGREKLLNKGVVSNVYYTQGNAECLPFSDNHFDLITIAFGLRNVTDKAKALASMQACLKPGGKLMVLEFSKPQFDLLTKAYDFYSFNVLPKIGKFVANDEASYQYLAESIRMHPDQETLKHMMSQAGLDDVRYHNLTGGIVALHIGHKY